MPRLIIYIPAVFEPLQRTELAPYAIGGMVYVYFAGSMDEVRVSGVARSADWVWAEHLNID